MKYKGGFLSGPPSSYASCAPITSIAETACEENELLPEADQEERRTFS